METLLKGKKSSHRITRVALPLTLFILCSLPLQIYAEEGAYKRAVGLAMEGRHMESEELYDQLLLENPDSVRLLIGRGYVRSWQKRYSAAEVDFKAVLEREPGNTDALMGLGYTYAWSGKSGAARARFLRVLEISPQRVEAQKGIALTALWQGNYHEAARRFQKILEKTPEDAEISVGLGQALLAAGKRDRAKKYFNDALAIEPGRGDATEGLKVLERRDPQIELSIWGGHTFRLNSTSIRSAELGVWLDGDTRLWGRYDNALSLDNPGLVRDGVEIPSLFIGGLRNWGGHYTSRLEVGKRELTGNVSQYLFEGEQVFYLGERRTFKLGGFAGIRDDSRTDWNIYTGTGLPLPSRFRIEPTLYYTGTGGIDENEWRLLLPVEYTFPKGIQATLFMAVGSVNSEVPGASGSLWALSSLINVPLSKQVSSQFLLRHEAPPTGEELTVISLGLTFRTFKE